MSAAERRWWLENTAPGALARAMGTDPWAVDHERAEAEVEATAKHYRRTYGRELTDSELAAVRFGAEQRSAPIDALRQAPSTTAEIVAAVNNTVVNAGWSYVPQFRGQHSGMARYEGGRWQGDPQVVAAAEAADAARRHRNSEQGEAPIVLRTIGGPT